MRKRSDISNQLGALVDMVSEIYKERNEALEEVDRLNVIIHKAIELLKNNISNNSVELRVEAIEILRGKK